MPSGRAQLLPTLGARCSLTQRPVVEALTQQAALGCQHGGLCTRLHTWEQDSATPWSPQGGRVRG